MQTHSAVFIVRSQTKSVRFVFLRTARSGQRSALLLKSDSVRIEGGMSGNSPVWLDSALPSSDKGWLVGNKRVTWACFFSCLWNLGCTCSCWLTLHFFHTSVWVCFSVVCFFFIKSKLSIFKINYSVTCFVATKKKNNAFVIIPPLNSILGSHKNKYLNKRGIIALPLIIALRDIPDYVSLRASNNLTLSFRSHLQSILHSTLTNNNATFSPIK